MKRIIDWFKASSRWKHAAVGAIVAMLSTVAGAAIAAFTWEICQRRDGGVFEWGDIAASMIGAAVGQTVQAGIVYGLSTLHGLALALGIAAYAVLFLLTVNLALLVYYWNKRIIPVWWQWSAVGLFGALIVLIGLTINAAAV